MAEQSSFPVWVGNLAPGITESVLLDLFGKFGPVKNVAVLRDENGVSKQCGFVSFCSYNVGIAASIGLDGCDVFGHIIETRGPDKLAIQNQPPKAANQETSDGRVLLDCVYFVEKKNCPFKVEQCPYRHCAATQNTDKVCQKWLNYECRDVNCIYRHPVINILKDKSGAGSEKNKSKSIPQPRCPSHNAFKCTGDCGDVECETHFLEMSDMVEHLKKAKEKTSIPQGACAWCKAVFFGEEERKKHACFQPKHQQTPFIPIYHPISASNMKSMPCSCKPDADGNFATTICTSCGSCYEHSGDTLSTFECSHDGVLSGHKCPNSPSVRNNDGKQCVDLEPIGVFWDIENCPVPRGKSAIDIVKKIREEFFTSKREAEFMCVCDISKEKKEIIEELNKSQVTVVHINATSKNAADDKLRQSLRRFAQSYPPPATVILVSGDINFAAELSDLRHRHNLTVICLHNAQAQSALLACAHESKRFDLFTDDIVVSISQNKTSEENGLQSELSVGNLPVGKDVSQIKIRLKKLSDNCGGKVASVTGRTAVMKFPNHQSAARAKKRMDNEDVFGSLIHVSYPVSKPSSPTKLPRTSSPTKSNKVPQPVKQDNMTLLDVINRGPQRINIIKEMPFGKKDTKKSTEPPAIIPPMDRNQTSVQVHDLYDEDLEEILCAPSNLPLQSSKPLYCAPVAPVPSYSNQQPFFNNNNCTYSASWQHPSYHQGLVPLPPQSMGYPFPVMGPHPLTASWLANLHSLTILEQQKGGVDIVVCNLDEAVGKKELKKKLASVFREHCKVYSVVLHSGEGIPLRAFIKVPKVSDAQIAVSKVNNQKIFSTSVIVTIVTEKEKELCFVSSEVTSVLKDTPLQWMPFNKFLSLFYEKCSHTFDMNVLAILPDIVTIVGKPGSEAICLSTPDLHTVKILLNDGENFAKEVHILLKQHKGYLLLGNFAASYWLKFEKPIEASDQGVRLSDALMAVANVCVKVDTGKEVVSWVKEGIINGGVFNKLQEISVELQDLLKAQPQYRLPLSQLISAYQRWFNRKSPFDPVNYGFSSVKDLLEALANVVQVQDEGVHRYVILTQRARFKALESEVRVLLESQPEYSLPLNNFMVVYQRCFGHECCFTDYGCDNLVGLIDKLSHIVKVHIVRGEGMITLLETERTTERPDPVTMETLAHEMKNLLLTSDKQQLAVSMVMTKYREKYGKNLNIRETGFPSLENMVTSIIPGVQVIHAKGENFICLPTKEGHSSTVRYLIELVSQQDGGFVPLKRLPSLYHKHFNKKLPLTVGKLHESVTATDLELQILGADNDQILCYTNFSGKEHQSHTFKKLANDIHCMLIKLPGCRMTRAALADIYNRQRGIGRVAKRWPESSNLDSLLQTMSNSIEVCGTGDFASVCLKQEYVLRCLARDIVTLLSASMGKYVPVSNIPKLYEKNFGRPLCTQHYGFVNITDMLDGMCSVVKVVGEGKRRVHLSPLQTFAIEAKQLLIHQGGCISLNRFAPCFQQYYNKPCKAADYGYSRLSEVIAAVPGVAETRGKGVDKMVIWIADGDVLLDCLGVSSTSSSTSDDQTQHDNDSPPITCEGSDTESVIVEEEMNDCQDTVVQDTRQEGGVDKANMKSALNWIMAPVPKTISEPDLHPQQGQQPLVEDLEDLISFREFAPNFSLTGLDQFYTRRTIKKQKSSDLCKKYDSPVDDMFNEDLEVFMANKTPLRSGAHSLVDSQSSISSERTGQPTHSSGPSPGRETSMSNRLSSISPGMYELSDVEAEIFNGKGNQGVGDGNSIDKISKCKEQRRPCRPLLAPFIKQSQDKTPSKKVTPVKLAVKFSMATKG